MANIDLIAKLNMTYGKNSPISRKTRLFSLNESLDPENIQKAISDSIASLGPVFTEYFDFGLPAEVVLLFIDVCNFSTRFSGLSGEEIGNYFDEYYETVIPIIYKYGGEIDKIMGDGIVCVFGPPFQNIALIDNISKANMCSKEIISVTKNTKFSSKIAFHCGTINYFKNKTGLYKEFTMIGKPLTELFRLESISIDQGINYFDGTKIREFYKIIINTSSSTQGTQIPWIHERYMINDLKGIDIRYFYSIKKDT